MNTLGDIISEIIKTGINPGNVNFYRIVDFAAGFDFGPHKHPDLEINYIIHGSCSMDFGDIIAHFRKNDCMVIYPDVEHSFHVDKKSKCTIVQLVFETKYIANRNLHPKLEKELALFYDLVSNDRKFFRIHDVPVIRQCLENIINEINHTLPNRGEMINLYFSELLILLSRQIAEITRGTQNVLHETVKKTLQIIHNEYRDANLSVTSIAEKCRISDRRLRTLFRNDTGMNLIDYLTRIRIQHASELLLKSNQNISEITYSSGYSSPEYFCRLFKKQTSFSPKDFRNNFRKSQ